MAEDSTQAFEPQDRTGSGGVGLHGLQGATQPERVIPRCLSATRGGHTFARFDGSRMDRRSDVAFAESYVAADLDEGDATGLDDPADHAFVMDCRRRTHEARTQIRLKGVDNRRSTVTRAHRYLGCLECPSAKEHAGRGAALAHEFGDAVGDLGLLEGEVRDWARGEECPRGSGWISFLWA